MLLPKSICVCIQCFKSLAPGIVLPKYHFWVFLGPDMDTEVGVVIYMHLKHSQDYIESTYIYIYIYKYGFMVLLLRFKCFC